MFSTQPSFKAQCQFAEDATVWRVLETTLDEPWLVLTMVTGVKRKLARTFFLTYLSDAISFINTAPTGTKAKSLRLVHPPGLSATGDWLFVPIRQISGQDLEIDGKWGTFVMTGLDNVHYGNFPFHRIDRKVGPLELLVKFS